MLILYLKISCHISQIWCYQIYLVLPRSPQFPDAGCQVSPPTLPPFLAILTPPVTLKGYNLLFRPPPSNYEYTHLALFSSPLAAESKLSPYPLSPTVPC